MGACGHHRWARAAFLSLGLVVVGCGSTSKVASTASSTSTTKAPKTTTGSGSSKGTTSTTRKSSSTSTTKKSSPSVDPDKDYGGGITLTTTCRDYLDRPSGVRHDAVIRMTTDLRTSSAGNPMWGLSTDAACGKSPGTKLQALFKSK